jgi:phenylacetate-coenzyme A ligase PaaK-like adenylate-forming protein
MRSFAVAGRQLLRALASGTTGRPIGVSFSTYEFRLGAALGVIRLLFDGQIAENDVVQLNTRSRATLGAMSFAAACARIGALVCPIGLVDPRATLAQLSERRKVPGKLTRTSVLLTYPSYLGRWLSWGWSSATDRPTSG